MASLEEMGKLMDELKADTQAKKAASQPKQEEAKVEEKKEEIVEEKVEEKAEDAPEEKDQEKGVDEPEAEKIPAEEVPPSLSERAQARIDGLIERQIEKDKKIIEMEKKLAELEAKASGGTKAASEYTKEQLIALLNDDTQKQYHGWAYDELSKLNSKAELSKFNQTIQAEKALASSYERAKEDFPDMADTTSPHWQLANEIYLRKNLINDPDGQYTAASLAYIELQKQAGSTKTPDAVLEKRLAKVAGKTSLATVNKKVVVSSQDVLNKLEKEADGKKPGSPEWNRYLDAVEKDRLAKKKK